LNRADRGWNAGQLGCQNRPPTPKVPGEVDVQHLDAVGSEETDKLPETCRARPQSETPRQAEPDNFCAGSFDRLGERIDLWRLGADEGHRGATRPKAGTYLAHVLFHPAHDD